MPLKSPLRATLAAFFLALAAAPAQLHAQAQATTGVIRGTITDTAGGTLAGASVTLRNMETNAERVLTTNDHGVYVATLLRVGTYDVTARALGFQEAKRPGLTLRLGETLDEVFITHEAATRGVQVTNTGREPLVSLRYFGPDAFSSVPNVGDAQRA